MPDATLITALAEALTALDTRPEPRAQQAAYRDAIITAARAVVADHEETTALAEGDAPVTRPDHDALLSELDTCAWFTDGTKNGELVELAYFTRHRIAKGLRDAMAALDADRSRADRVFAVVAEMSDDDEYPLESWWRGRIMRALSAIPTAEQEAANA